MNLQQTAQLKNNPFEEQIWQLIVENDLTFIPPLSARESTTDSDLTLNQQLVLPKKYFQTLQQQPIIVATENEQLAGFMSYKECHPLPTITEFEHSTYVSTLIVSEQFRHRGLATALYERLFKESQTGIISTRTWSTNHSHLKLLKKLDFKLYHTIKNDRGLEIDTVYYAKILENNDVKKNKSL